MSVGTRRCDRQARLLVTDNLPYARCVDASEGILIDVGEERSAFTGLRARNHPWTSHSCRLD